MIRTNITPEQTDIHLSIPEKYVGRKLEILLYPVDELTDGLEKEQHGKKPSDFKGTLPKEEGEKFLEYLKHTRNELERNI